MPELVRMSSRRISIVSKERGCGSMYVEFYEKILILNQLHGISSTMRELEAKKQLVRSKDGIGVFNKKWIMLTSLYRISFTK